MEYFAISFAILSWGLFPVRTLHAAQAPRLSTEVAVSSPGLKTFTAGCGTLAYSELGAGNPIVVLAGGPGMNPAYMSPVMKMLAHAGRRVVLLHQRGTGQSADAAMFCRERMSLKGAVADLEELRAHLGVEKLTLVGHSWGGMLAMAYLQQYPDHVAGLLLLDTGPIRSVAFSTEEAAVRARLTTAEQTSLRQARDEAEIEQIERRVFFAHAENARLLEESLPPGAPLWYKSVGALIGPDLGSFDVTPALKAYQGPVMLIFGRMDPDLFTVQQIRHIHARARAVIVQGTGHYPWLENPVQTAAAIRALLAVMP